MSGRAWLGLGLVVFGGGLLLDRMGVLDFGGIFSTWWPLILIVIGAVQLATRSGGYLGGVILIGAGALFQARNLNLLPESIWPLLWPAALVLAGVWLILGRLGSSPMQASSEDTISAFAAFGGIGPRNNSSSFRGGSITALFGGAEVDLREAQLAPDGASLEVTSAFGGAEIWVPDDWNVRISGIPIFGAWEDKTRGTNKTDPNAPTLKVSVFVMFGGVEVKN